MDETLESFLGRSILHYYDKVRRFYFLDAFLFCISQIIWMFFSLIVKT